MMVGAIVAACNSPLSARRDGGWSGDDAPADGDAASVDAPPPDASSDKAGVDAVCIIAPIDEARATEIYTNLRFQNALASIPDFVITATEKSVPGLWDTLQAQLFNGKVESKSGSYAGECSFLYRHCTVTLTSDNCNMFGPIKSGLVANGAFYYSSPLGSGISYTVLDKLAPDGDTWVLTQSQFYYNPSQSPPGLVVAPGDGKILVYRATVSWEKFNEWLNPELIGTLKDFGDRLGILDADGNELGPQLP